MSVFRFWFNPALEMNVDTYYSREIYTYETAKSALDEVAFYTLNLHETSLMHDYSNVGGIQQRIGGEWIDIDDREGDENG